MTSTATGRGLLELTPVDAELCTTTSGTEEEPLKQDINKKIMGAGKIAAPTF